MPTEATSVPRAPDSDVLLEMWHRMRLIRLFDEAASKLLQAGEIPGVIHLTVGQEGTAVGACMALGRKDYVVGNHRSHGHALAKGAAPGPLLAELLGKATGVCKGKGGSQHVADASVGNLLGSAVLGSAVPVAVGIALASSMKKTGRVCLCFFGEGAANEGAIHESMNLASIWKVPLIFFCENNGYAVTVSASYSLSVANVADRSAAYGMPAESVDGQDVGAVYEVVARAAERARSGGGPTLIEAKTYRICDHAENLPTQPYRSPEEVERWRRRDPILIFRSRLVEEGVASEDELAELEERAQAEIADALRFAKESPFPGPEALFEDLFAEPLAVRPAVA